MTGHTISTTNQSPKDYYRTRFDCLPAADKVAIIAFMCGTNPDILEGVRDIDHDIRFMLDAGIKHIDQVSTFVKDILDSADFDTEYFDEWVNTDPFKLDFNGTMFWHIFSEMDADMRAVVRFCYPFDDESSLVRNGETPFIEAFCR